MTASDSVWLNFFSILAVIGAIIVVAGVILEGAELLVKFSSEMKWRIWVVNIFGRNRRRTLVLCAKKIKPNLCPFEVIALAVLVFGLGIELLGSFTAERMQSKDNSELAATNILLSAQISQLNNQTALLIASNLQAGITFEELKSNNIMLGAQMAPREI
jgi:hypothetical protein